MRRNCLERVVPSLSIVVGAVLGNVTKLRVGTSEVGLGNGSGVVIARSAESCNTHEWVGDLAGTAVAELAVSATLNIALRVPLGRNLVDVDVFREVRNPVADVTDRDYIVPGRSNLIGKAPGPKRRDVVVGI